MDELIGDSHRLGEALLEFTARTVETLGRHHFPGWRIPRTFAGHWVAADVRADLLFTLTHLADGGIETIAGTPIDDVIRGQLAQVQGRHTHTFFSYRIAETLLRRGRFTANPLLADCDDAQRAEVADATDSRDWIELLDAGALPRNYAAVLSRCELARRELGLAEDDRTLTSLTARLHDLLAENPEHHLDDSNDRSGRFDIYTADIWLFCEPLAPHLGSLWPAGARAALALVDTVAGPDGAAVPWGRSTGVLATALTVELAALALGPGLRDDRAAAWVRRGVDAFRATAARFAPDGVCDAHQHRNQDAYRGPARRLQLTLDVLGKLAWAGAALRDHEVTPVAPHGETYRAVESLLELAPGTTAGAWVHSGPGRRVVVPFVGVTRSHYLPALHAPGTFETPVDNDQVVSTPLIISRARTATTGELPDRIETGPGRVTARWDRLPVSGRGLEGTAPEPVAGTCTTTITVAGRSVVIDHELVVADRVDALALQIPETARAPLVVEFEADVPAAATTIDVRGVAEWSSPYSGLVRVHQLDLEPAPTVRMRARITPKLRVASTAFGHGYDRLLYRPLRDRVLELPSPIGVLADHTVDAADIELLHLHWPEWFGFDDLAVHEDLIATLADRGVPVVWTAHNLTPHDRRPEVFDPIYQRWAETAHAVIHHTAWGRDRMLARYRFRADCEHAVIPHGHFGDNFPTASTTSRADAERHLGLAPAPLRIGLVGAPRADKRVHEFLAAVAATRRDDIEVVCWSLGFGETAPADPRIAIAARYREVDARTYAIRLAACDAIALPFDPEGDMLATGTVFDAIGLGIPALVSEWPFLTDTLGGAGVPVGHRTDEIAAALETLTIEQLGAARARTEALRSRYEWGPIADATFALFERVVLRGV
jgi:glycosyltransferase involved in cell wall biosynthesis